MKQATSNLISKTTLALVFILGSFTGCKKDTPSQLAIDPNSFSCTLTYHGGDYNNPYIMTIGNFTCKLFQKSNPALLITASGQFKLYSN